MGALTRAIRNVSRRKMRALLVIIALGFSMAIMISIPPGIVANQKATQNMTENFNSTISGMQEEIDKTATLIECQTSSGRGMPSGMPQFGPRQQEEVFINETVVDEIRSIDGVNDVVCFLEKSSEVTTSETVSTPRGDFTISRPIYTIMGVPLNSSFIDSYSILPTNLTAGRNLHEGDSAVVLMSSNLTDYLGLRVGDEVKIYGESFTVVGVYDSTDQGNMQTRTVYMNITDTQTITSNTGNVSRLDVYAEDVSHVDGIADVIEAAYSDLYVTTYKDRLANLERMQEMYETTLENTESTISQTQSVATQEIIIAVLATSLIVLFVMLYTVRERTKEIGILKAIGFSNWNVMSQFMLEGILMSLMAGVIGVVIGIVGAPILSSLLLPSVNLFPTQQQRGFFGQVPSQTMNFGTAFSQSVTVAPDLQTILLAFVVAVMLGALGSLYPAWRASRTSPMEALRYE